MLEAQEGLTYAQLLALAQRAEQVGLAGLYRSDHYSSVGGREGVGSTDAWATLAGLARETTTLTLGTLVSPATFRTIGNLAKTVATVSAMAGAGPDGGSRIVLGMGTGWLEVEHRRHGFPFEDLDTRFRRLEEHLELLSRFWDEAAQPFDFDGTFVTTADSRFVPVPQPRPRIVIGGHGMRRTPRLAARFADELNGVFLSVEDCARQRAALSQACAEAGRDPASVGYSLMTRCVVGADEDDFRRRAAREQERSGQSGPLDDWIAQLSPVWITGTPQQAGEHLARLAEAGVEQVMLQHMLFDDLDMLDVIAELT
jgi:alkanesulfonate monooxygenase SsuD/methylene tetrahydromethanopterin reductase-like flavin-dependent oxidoreductase (luciferase family)